MDTETPTFDEWVIVELLGHRRLAGRIREVQLAGAGFLRLDIPATDGHSEQTQYIAPGSVYALHPTTQEIATAVAARCRPQPVSRFELPPPPVDTAKTTPFENPWGSESAQVSGPRDASPTDTDPDDDEERELPF